MQAANSSRTRPSIEKDIQSQKPLTEGEFWLAFLMQLSQLLLIFHKAVIHVNKMSAHLYHPRPTTCLSKSGEQAICWLKLHYYINVPIFIFLTHFWAQTSRSLPSSASTQLSHNHHTHPLPDWCINVHLSVPQRSQRWSYSCLHPVTAVCGHLTIQPPLFSFVQRQEPRDHLFSFPFSHALGMLGSFVNLFSQEGFS